jgi:hypothetical protein
MQWHTPYNYPNGEFRTLGKDKSRHNIGQNVYFQRLTLTPSPYNSKLTFTFQLKQFPIVVSFTMTINKSQGQFVKNVGIYLSKPIFSHG